MTIIIYHMEEVKGDIKMVEYGRFDNNTIKGKINVEKTTAGNVLERFNRGYWRTSEVFNEI